MSAPKDDSNKVVRQLMKQQRLVDDEKRHKEWTTNVLNESFSAASIDYSDLWNPNAPIGERLLATAQNVYVEVVREQARLAAEEEASYKIVKELAKAEIRTADDKTRHLAAKKKLEPAEVLKRKQAEYDEKKVVKRQKFLEFFKKRKRPEKITNISATIAQQGQVINVVIKREGLRFTQDIPDIQKKTLGVSEWLDVYEIIKKRTSASMMAVHNLIENLFEQVCNFEQKFDIKDSVLKDVDGSGPIPKRQRTLAYLPLQLLVLMYHPPKQPYHISPPCHQSMVMTYLMYRCLMVINLRKEK